MNTNSLTIYKVTGMTVCFTWSKPVKLAMMFLCWQMHHEILRKNRSWHQSHTDWRRKRSEI